MNMNNENQARNTFNEKSITIESTLSKNEVILEKLKPHKKCYIWSIVAPLLPLGIIWAIIDISILTFVLPTAPREILWFIIPFFALHLMPVWMCIGSIIKANREVHNIEYAITDKRIIIKSGLIGIDFKSVFYADINDVNLTVGIFGRIFKTGTITISTSGAKRVVLHAIENPYEIYPMIQKIVVDLKTDIHYPNKLRPDENPGYNTKYIRNKDKE